MKSWKTTLTGVLQFITILSTQVGYALDSDPLTVINYSLIVASALTMIAFIKSRDNDVSSEDEGVR